MLFPPPRILQLTARRIYIYISSIYIQSFTQIYIYKCKCVCVYVHISGSRLCDYCTTQLTARRVDASEKEGLNKEGPNLHRTAIRTPPQPATLQPATHTYQNTHTPPKHARSTSASTFTAPSNPSISPSGSPGTCSALIP